MKVLLVAVAMVALPTLSYAACSGYGHQEAAMTCADGLVWDSETRTCVTVSG